MFKSKLTHCAEGLIVTAAGAVFTVLSLRIRSNPISVEGVLNLFVQARFIPLLLSVLITLLGVGFTVSQWKKAEATAKAEKFSLRELSVIALTVAYLVILSCIGFAIPTPVYLCALLFLVNRGRKPLQLLLLTALYSLIALLVIPGILNLQLL